MYFFDNDLRTPYLKYKLTAWPDLTFMNNSGVPATQFNGAVKIFSIYPIFVFICLPCSHYK